MNIEARGRSAAEALRSATPVDVEEGLSRLRRTRRRRDAGRVAGACAAVAVIAGGGFVVTDGDDRPLPADGPTPRNGQIIDTDGTEAWLRTAPELPATPPYPVWLAADPVSGAFLYYLGTEGDRLVIVDADGTQAEFPCPAPSGCRDAVFGPDAGEVTLFDRGADYETMIVGFDGKVRETISLSPPVTDTGTPAYPGQELRGLAWAPDGTRLAFATEPSYGCQPSQNECETKVWLVDRDGGEPRAIFTEATPDARVDGQYPNTPKIVHLAWSPDGTRLGIAVAPQFLPEPGEEGAPSTPSPRLVAVSVDGEARTLFTYGPDHHEGRTLSGDYDRHFAFAWAPDGTRIAVTDARRLVEISATDGAVLAEHPRKEAHGPLAWLPEGS